MSLGFDDVQVGGQLRIGTGICPPIKEGDTRINGSMLCEGPGVFGGPTEFPGNSATIMIGRTRNSDPDCTPADHSLHVKGDIKTTDAAGTASIVLNANVGSDDDATFTGGVIIGGNLTVNGTTTTVATTNTVVEDQLLFLATGSKDANKDAGIVVQDGSTDLQGAALYHDTNDSRWAVASGVAHNATSITALEYVTTVKSSTDFPDTTSGSFGVGEMWVDTDTEGGDIWIRVG